MKNTKRILTLVVAIALVVVCIASVTASAVPAKIYGGIGITPGQYIEEYINRVVYRNDDMESQFSAPNYLGSGDPLFVGEQSIEDTVRQGAVNIYDENDHQNGFVTFNYGPRSEAVKYPDTTAVSNIQRVYKTMVFSSLTAPEGSPHNGYVIEFDLAVLSYLDDKGTKEEEDDEWLWEFPASPTESGSDIAASVWLEFLPGGSATSLNDLGQQLYSGTFLTIERVSDPAEKAFNLKFAGAPEYKVNGDEWVHVTWVFDAENWQFSMYVGDDYNGRTLLGTRQVNKDTYPVNFRIGGRCNFGQISFDNILTYRGKDVHDPLYLERMSEGDRFVYFVDAFSDESLPESDRYKAYQQAKILRDNNNGIIQSVDPDVVGARKVFDKISADESVIGTLEAVAAKNNAIAYYEKALDARNTIRLISNASTRSSKAAAADTFLASCAGLIDMECSEYNEAVKILSAVRGEISQDESAVKFVNTMEKFSICEDLGFSNAMRNHYNTAGEHKNNSVQPSMYSDDAPADPNSMYKRFVKAWEDYDLAFAILDEVELRTNASRFVELVNILIEREDVWFTDDGTCQRLWKNAREIVISGRYDPSSAAGFNDAYIAFTTHQGINDRFWEAIQIDHVEILQERLDGFNAEGVTYIGRFAIIVYIEHYIAANEDMIDPSNTRVAEIYAIAENYKRNLPLYEQDYLKMLEENANKFMDLISVIKQMTTYEQIKPLFDQATDCYYGMDIPDDETMEAVVYYEELALRMNKIEEDCVILSEAVADIAAAETKDALYAALVKGYATLENVDTTIEGVQANLDAYNEAYNAYASAVGAVNSELSSATDVVSSVRSYCGIDDLVDYVSTIVE